MKKLKVLLLSDEVDRGLYDHFRRDMLDGIDVIISCGDLPARYLEFLSTLFPGPVFYVCGNHDEQYKFRPPEGCICIEDKIVEYEGVRFLGLGGSMRYRDGDFQYTEKEMERRIRRLYWKLRRKKGFDVLVAHSPAKGHHDGKGAHSGFACFNALIRKYSPRYFFYGHVHLSYDASSPRCSRLGNTITVNAFQKHILEIEVPEH